MSTFYEQISELPADERAAVEQYCASSGFFHLAVQSDFRLVLDRFSEYQDFIGKRYLELLLSACKNRYRTTRAVTLYSGHGNSFGVLGSLGSNAPSAFVGMRLKYPGFVSTSEDLSVATAFCEARGTNAPALLEFELPAGFNLLPVCGHEFEFILPPGSEFQIVKADSRGTSGFHFSLVVD